MGKMATSVVFLTGDDEPESVWASGPGAEETAAGEPGVAGVINAPAATAVPAAAAAATHGKEEAMHAFDIRI